MSDISALVDRLGELSDGSDEETINLLGKAVRVWADMDPELGGSSEGSSQPRPRKYIRRDRCAAESELMKDYFAENPTYPPSYFRRRFRMRKELFLRIVQDICSYAVEPLPDYFKFFHQRPDALGVQGFTTIQKCTAAIRQLAYGTAPDAFDEYLKMGERTAADCLDNFCKCVRDLYRGEYMRNPTAQDIQRLYTKHSEQHGFPGMLGSIDCMHWAWEKCPNAWKGQYTRGDQGHPTIMLEAVASYDLWIWHSYFGVAGSNNDINVLQRSPLFDAIVSGTAPEATFVVNGTQYRHGYYLADGIYPEWATFVKAYSCPQDEKKKKFKEFQESARKDIERAFGVLQGRWAIMKNPARAMVYNKIRRIVDTCIILHNMIVEDSGFAISPQDDGIEVEPRTNTSRLDRNYTGHLENIQAIRHRETHHNLRFDLTEHIWNLP